jgi:MFS family permease
MVHWKRNLIVLCGAQFLTLMGWSAYLPFIPYYVQELGIESYAVALAWLAGFNTGGAIAMMISSPIWGGLADRLGRKPMVIRATLAGALLAFAMSLTRTPMQLVIKRINVLRGLFGMKPSRGVAGAPSRASE